jgi:hypothetical protein
MRVWSDTATAVPPRRNAPFRTPSMAYVTERNAPGSVRPNPGPPAQRVSSAHQRIWTQCNASANCSARIVVGMHTESSYPALCELRRWSSHDPVAAGCVHRPNAQHTRPLQLAGGPCHPNRSAAAAVRVPASVLTRPSHRLNTLDLTAGFADTARVYSNASVPSSGWREMSAGVMRLDPKRSLDIRGRYRRL